jgi:hypothetical protein
LRRGWGGVELNSRCLNYDTLPENIEFIDVGQEFPSFTWEERFQKNYGLNCTENIMKYI